MARRQSKCWCFTLNNPALDEATGLARLPRWDPTSMDYLVAELEHAQPEDAGLTPHWQGYVRFKDRKRMSTAILALNIPGAHMEKPDGSEEQNRAYCQKERTSRGDRVLVIEQGTFDPKGNTQGRRSDLEAVASAAMAGDGVVAIAQAYPSDFIRYHSGIQALIDAVAPPPPVIRAVSVCVLWGATGTGKTHRIRTSTAPQDLYSVQPGRDPWGTYRGQKVLLFDEFDCSAWKLQQMNMYLDKWSVELDARYHNRYAAWTHVAICANTSPTTWYREYSPELRAAFFRRLLGSVWMVSDKEDPPVLDPDFPAPDEEISPSQAVSNIGDLDVDRL